METSENIILRLHFACFAICEFLSLNENVSIMYLHYDFPTIFSHFLLVFYGAGGKSKCTVATNRMAWAESQWYPELFEKLGYQVDPRKVWSWVGKISWESKGMGPRLPPRNCRGPLLRDY